MTTGTRTDTAFPSRPRPGSYRHEAAFVGGAWRAVNGDAWLPVIDSGTENELGRVREASVEDVDVAVAAAAGALPGWSATTRQERAESLLALRAHLSSRADEIAAVISAEVGMAIRLSGPVQVGSALQMLDAMAKVIAEDDFTEQIGNTLVVPSPVGVVGAITPWNYPLFQSIAKIGAALAAGCTVVHKPSELAPLSAFIIAEAVDAAGLPAGAYNLVPGRGVPVGEALAGHPGVDKISFTGSTATGRRVYELAARSIKRIALELGGKSASVLLDDADIQTAVKATVNRAFLNSGQTCDAWTRLLVPRERVDEVVERVASAVERLPLGDPFDPDTRLGPLVSSAQVERVARYVADALAAGAKAEIGGGSAAHGFERGYYFAPTVLSNVTAEMTVAREEVFGPVLAILASETEEDALSIANGTEYGLSGAVWSSSHERAMRFAHRMCAGQVVVNGGAYNPLAPFGGVKQSGLGREFGRYGVLEFVEPKALQL
jgi:acyl-CoA reductase-like NAD-dependent aldehyde dehydrogenase